MKFSDEMRLDYVLSEAAKILKLARPSDLKNKAALESVGHIKFLINIVAWCWYKSVA